jgi:hypothetical protein
MAKRSAKKIVAPAALATSQRIKPATPGTSGEGPSSRELLCDYQAGASEAANLIFHRYVERMLALARSRMSSKLRQRVDPEDVVQSAGTSKALRRQSPSKLAVARADWQEQGLHHTTIRQPAFCPA